MLPTHRRARQVLASRPRASGPPYSTRLPLGCHRAATGLPPNERPTCSSNARYYLVSIVATVDRDRTWVRPSKNLKPSRHADDDSWTLGARSADTTVGHRLLRRTDRRISHLQLRPSLERAHRPVVQLGSTVVTTHLTTTLCAAPTTGIRMTTNRTTQRNTHVDI